MENGSRFVQNFLKNLVGKFIAYFFVSQGHERVTLVLKNYNSLLWSYEVKLGLLKLYAAPRSMNGSEIDCFLYL